MSWRRILAPACFALALVFGHPSGRAGEAADATRSFLETGRFAAGADAMAKLLAAAPANEEARFALGLLQFALAVQHFGVAQYRQGLHAPRGLGVPLLRLPTEFNPNPEEASYENQRAVLRRFLDDLLAVSRTLDPIGDASVKIPLDLAAIRFDFAGSANPAEATRLDAIIAAIGGSPPGGGPRQSFDVALDRSDAHWLNGYSRLLAAHLEFVLAYDWRETFEIAGPTFYPRVAGRRIPAAADETAVAGGGLTGDDRSIADAIALVHLIRWPLAEPERMKAALGHLRAVVGLSRKSWDSILAETDDDREWIPSPTQKSGVLGLPVTGEQVATWRAALDEFEAVLEGRKLVPHWRFSRGIDLRRFFEAPAPFDLVLTLSGHAMVPFLADGEVIRGETWRQWERVFGGNFLMYAIWFN